jgi:hypothetical protein
MKRKADDAPDGAVSALIELLGAIQSVCEAGGEVSVTASDPLNPLAGFDARVRVPDHRTRRGYREFRGSSSVVDRRDTPLVWEALTVALNARRRGRGGVT